MEVAAQGDSAGSPERRADPKIRKLIAVQPGTGLDAALALMVRSRVRHLAVLDRGRCVGVVHETDLLWRLAATPMAALRETVVDVTRPPVPVVDSATARCSTSPARRSLPPRQATPTARPSP